DCIPDCVDRRRVLAAAVEGEYPVGDRVVEYRIGVCSRDADHLSGCERHEVEHRHRRIATVARVALAGPVCESDSMHSPSVRNFGYELTRICVDHLHARRARDEYPAASCVECHVVPTTISGDRYATRHMKTTGGRLCAERCRYQGRPERQRGEREKACEHESLLRSVWCLQIIIKTGADHSGVLPRGAGGKRTSATVPLPASDRNVMRAWWTSALHCAIDRPRPAPTPRARAASAR